MIEIANKFNMVDMGGIDVVESQGVTVEGLFSRLLTAIQNCQYQILYNWKFSQIEIAPSPVELVFDGEKVSINEAITVTEDDVVHIYSLEPEPIVPVIESLTVIENGTYAPIAGVDGYAPVTVEVEPVIESLNVTENGVYEVPVGVDGFNPVAVNVPSSIGLDIDAYAVDYVPGYNANQALSGGFSFNTLPGFSYVVTKIRVFARETTANAYISDSNGNIIASVLNAAVIANQWNDIVLQSPAILSPNTAYVVWYSMPTTALRYYSGIPAASSGLIRNIYGRYSETINTFPARGEGNTYGVDFFIEKIYKQ